MTLPITPDAPGTPATPSTQPLHTLAPMCPAQVVGLQGEGDEEDRDILLRLVEIGFLPGEPVQVLARGFPSSDPLAVRIGDSTFALRKREAALISVRMRGGK